MRLRLAWCAVTTLFSIYVPLPSKASDRCIRTTSTVEDGARLSRGRYLVQITGCNDCHTPSYTERAGKVADSAWLTGSPLGFRGPWGTTYATNLRLMISQMSEAQWVHTAHTVVARAPMPSFTLHEMTARDLEDIYRFVRHLGATGKTAPDYLPPEREPPPPYVLYPGVKS